MGGFSKSFCTAFDSEWVSEDVLMLCPLATLTNIYLGDRAYLIQQPEADHWIDGGIATTNPPPTPNVRMLETVATMTATYRAKRTYRIDPTVAAAWIDAGLAEEAP